MNDAEVARPAGRPRSAVGTALVALGGFLAGACLVGVTKLQAAPRTWIDAPSDAGIASRLIASPSRMADDAHATPAPEVEAIVPVTAWPSDAISFAPRPGPFARRSGHFGTLDGDFDAAVATD